MKALSRSDILNADDLELSDPIDVPEWGGYVRVRTMMGEWRDRMELNMLDRRAELTETLPEGARLASADLMANLRAETVAACACDDKGALLFKVGDVEALGRKSAKALDRVFSVAKELNAITDEDVEALAGN